MAQYLPDDKGVKSCSECGRTNGTHAEECEAYKGPYTEWSQLEPFDAGDAQRAILEVLVDLEFLTSAMDCEDTPKQSLQVTVLGCLEDFQGNCFDDQHDGGAHREDLILVNRIYQWAGQTESQDNCASILELPEDEGEDSEEWSEAIIAWEQKWIFATDREQ
jgi:hypothetical protein